MFPIRPKKILRPPPPGSRIDWNNSLTNGLQFFAMPIGGPWPDFAHGCEVNASSGLLWDNERFNSVFGHIPALRTSHGDYLQYALRGDRPQFTSSSEAGYTHIHWATFSAWVNYRYLARVYTDGDNFSGLRRANTNFGVRINGGSGLACTNTGTSTFSGEHVWGNRWINPPGTNDCVSDLWVDGAFHSTGQDTNFSSQSKLLYFDFGHSGTSSGADNSQYLGAFWTRGLEDAELEALTADPQELLALVRPSRSPVIFVPGAAAISMPADAGTVSISGQAADLLYGRHVDAASGSVSIAGQAASLEIGYRLDAASGAYTIAGAEVTLKAGREVVADSGSLTIGGQDAGLFRGYPLTADSGSLSITGQAATLEADRKIVADAGALTIDGKDATLKIPNVKMVADAGSLSIAGTAATLSVGVKVVAASGSVTITGTAADLFYGRAVIADSGAVSVAGQDASLEVGKVMVADVGSVTIAGQAASLLRGLSTVADTGALSITGQDASLERGLKLTADVGALTIAGQDATLTYTPGGAEMVADAGSLTIGGQAASLEVGRKVTADSGSFAITGQDVTLTKRTGYSLAVDAGSLTITGVAATLDRIRLIKAGSASFTLTGQAVTLISTGWMAWRSAGSLTDQWQGNPMYLVDENGNQILTEGGDPIIIGYETSPLLESDWTEEESKVGPWTETFSGREV